MSRSVHFGRFLKLFFLHFGQFLKLFSDACPLPVVVSRTTDASCSIRPPMEQRQQRQKGAWPWRRGCRSLVLYLPREGAVRGMLASTRCLPCDCGQLASRPCATCRGSGGCMRTRKPGPTSSYELGLLALVAIARCLARLGTACLVSVGSFPRHCLLHAPRERASLAASLSWVCAKNLPQNNLVAHPIPVAISRANGGYLRGKLP